MFVNCFSIKVQRKADVNQEFYIKAAIRLPGVPPREGWAPVRLNKPFL